MSRFVLALSLTAVLALAGCDSGASSVDCGNSIFTIEGSMTARIDGDRFSATCFDVDTINGDLLIEGVEVRPGPFDTVEVGARIEFDIDESFVGVSTIDGSDSRTEAEYTTASDARFEAESGVIAVEEFSASRLRGTFSFTTVNGIEVTDGEFDIRL